jgi:hypothetical protein
MKCFNYIDGQLNLIDRVLTQPLCRKDTMQYDWMGRQRWPETAEDFQTHFTALGYLYLGKCSSNAATMMSTEDCHFLCMAKGAGQVDECMIFVQHRVDADLTALVYCPTALDAIRLFCDFLKLGVFEEMMGQADTLV